MKIALSVLLTAIIACGALLSCSRVQKAMPSQDPDPSVASFTEGESLPTSGLVTGVSQAPCLVGFDAGGTGALKLGHALFMYCAIHQKLPETADALDLYQPFDGAFGGYAVEAGEGPDGAEMILASRSVTGLSPAALGVPLPDCTPDHTEGSSPALGRHGENQRYLIFRSAGPPALAELVGIGENYFHQYLGELQASLQGSWHPDGLEYNSNEPATSQENAGLGFLASFITYTASDLRRHSADAPNPHSLDELAEQFGGIVKMVNPITGAPLKQVSLADAKPGSYTDLSSEHGVLILVHYSDKLGKVSSAACGKTTFLPDKADPSDVYEVKNGKLVLVDSPISRLQEDEVFQAPVDTSSK